MGELDDELECGNQAKDLWTGLSNDWVHTTGFTEKVAEQIENRSTISE